MIEINLLEPKPRLWIVKRALAGTDGDDLTAEAIARWCYGGEWRAVRWVHGWGWEVERVRQSKPC